MKKYDIHTITREEIKEMIALGDDSEDNQIRISTNGDVFLSSNVRMECLDGIAARFETFNANNGYVGVKASNREEYIDEIYQTIKHWVDHQVPYVDAWICKQE